MPIFWKSKSSAGYTAKSHNDFERYLSSIANDYQANNYQLFSRNCREYSQKLLNFLDPDNAREAKARNAKIRTGPRHLVQSSMGLEFIPEKDFFTRTKSRCQNKR